MSPAPQPADSNKPADFIKRAVTWQSTPQPQSVDKEPRPLGAGVMVLSLLDGLCYGFAGFVEPTSDWVERTPRLLQQLEGKAYPIKKTLEEVSKTAEQVDRIASISRPPIY